MREPSPMKETREKLEALQTTANIHAGARSIGTGVSASAAGGTGSGADHDPKLAKCLGDSRTCPASVESNEMVTVHTNGLRQHSVLLRGGVQIWRHLAERRCSIGGNPGSISPSLTRYATANKRTSLSWLAS